MADDSSQEKTEDPTPRRLQKARDQGEVARSRELTIFLMLLVGFLGIAILAPFIVENIVSLAKFCFEFGKIQNLEIKHLLKTLYESLQLMMISLLPLFIVLIIAAIISPILLGGMTFATEPLQIKLERLDPLKGLKRIWSWQGVVELLKSVIKFILLAIVSISLLWSTKEQLFGLSFRSIEQGIVLGMSLLIWVLLVTTGSLILVVLVDVPFQLWSYKKKLRMSLQEIKEELKESEGTPEVKARIRKLQRESARRRMMSDLPKADVVITNPTHFAVAIRYKEGEFRAPILVAKGTDLVAERIKSIANDHKVTVVSLPPLARALYFSTEIGDEIPSALYVSIAKVLAYVYQLKKFKKGKSTRPLLNEKDIEIPESLKR